MNERSIFSASTGNRWRWASEEYPVPKSSIAIRTPSALIAVSRRAVSSMLRIRVVSVISIVSAAGSRPLSVERAFDVGDQLVGVELASGHVDGHADRVPGRPPGGALVAGLLENPAARPR